MNRRKLTYAIFIHCTGIHCGLQDCNAVLKRLHGDDCSVLGRNLVSFGPVSGSNPSVYGFRINSSH